MAALIVIQHCYIHTERDTNYPTPGGPSDFYMYHGANSQLLTCAEIKQTADGKWWAHNMPNSLTQTFASRTEAKAWIVTMCKGAPDDPPR
jgi:hypothetical protein